MPAEADDDPGTHDHGGSDNHEAVPVLLPWDDDNLGASHHYHGRRLLHNGRTHIEYHLYDDGYVVNNGPLLDYDLFDLDNYEHDDPAGELVRGERLHLVRGGPAVDHDHLRQPPRPERPDRSPVVLDGRVGVPGLPVEPDGDDPLSQHDAERQPDLLARPGDCHGLSDIPRDVYDHDDSGYHNFIDVFDHRAHHDDLHRAGYEHVYIHHDGGPDDEHLNYHYPAPWPYDHKTGHHDDGGDDINDYEHNPWPDDDNYDAAINDDKRPGDQPDRPDHHYHGPAVLDVIHGRTDDDSAWDDDLFLHDNHRPYGNHDDDPA